jgi:hypothetical protein
MWCKDARLKDNMHHFKSQFFTAPPVETTTRFPLGTWQEQIKTPLSISPFPLVNSIDADATTKPRPRLSSNQSSTGSP